MELKKEKMNYNKFYQIQELLKELSTSQGNPTSQPLDSREKLRLET